jgi:dTMP kinase
MFITFEGGEGTGKSTQVKLLAEHLRAIGRDVLTTREPGGTPEAEALRALLVTGETGRWTPQAEALLNYAARDSHLNQVIRPALAAGKIVICDRFMDSTRAYQGFAGGCPMRLIDELEKAVVADTRPTITLVFDLDPSIGLARAGARGSGAEDRYERKGSSFHEKLRQGFMHIASHEPKRCKVIDAHADVETVAAKVWIAVNG